MDRACTTNGHKRQAYRLLVGESEGKRAVGRPTGRWVDNIMTDLAERDRGRGDVDWIGLAPDREQWKALANAVTNSRVP
jgi:hypothetical protein